MFTWRPLPSQLDARVRRLRYHDEGHGYDRFGLHPDGVARGLAITLPLYRHWFRVQSHHFERAQGLSQAIFAANHSGTLPLDAMMIWADVLHQSDPPTALRVVIDHFVNQLPVFNLLFARAGAIGGSRANVANVLSRGESMLVFPEGVPGITKPYAHRYRLQRWRPGHAELAIRHRVPIVPVAVIGAEEQLPTLLKLPLRVFGSPFVPLPAAPFPLPVRYHIWYGEPLPIHERYPPGAAKDPEALDEAAGTVRDAVQALIVHGLARREGVFQ